MKTIRHAVTLLLFPFLIATSAQAAKPIALVYEGAGSCTGSEGDCSGAAQVAAEFSGYQVVRVGPSALTATSTEADYKKVFGQAAVWVQPGGHSRKFLVTITPETKAGLQRFLKEGGGYVGFCAGAFSATEYDADLDLKGLNIFPGKTAAYPNETIDTFFDEVVSHFNENAYYNQILELVWNGKKRQVYFEEGASIDFTGVPANQVEVTARLKSGLPISARAAYGLGRVYITGAHPEAPKDWLGALVDSDGPDYDLVKEMMDWASNLSKRGIRR